MECPKCKHWNSRKQGMRVYQDGECKQRYQCRYCESFYVLGEERKIGRPKTQEGCREEGCEGKGYSQGYCSKHYQRWLSEKKNS